MNAGGMPLLIPSKWRTSSGHGKKRGRRSLFGGLNHSRLEEKRGNDTPKAAPLAARHPDKKEVEEKRSQKKGSISARSVYLLRGGGGAGPE